MKIGMEHGIFKPWRTLQLAKIMRNQNRTGRIMNRSNPGTISVQSGSILLEGYPD